MPKKCSVSLHDALPISGLPGRSNRALAEPVAESSGVISRTSLAARADALRPRLQTAPDAPAPTVLDSLCRDYVLAGAQRFWRTNPKRTQHKTSGGLSFAGCREKACQRNARFPYTTLFRSPACRDALTERLLNRLLNRAV